MSDMQPEVWLRGPVPGVPALLQPVAHALLQAREEVSSVAAGLPAELLWTRPRGVASAGFHLQHLAGVIDRLFTYARGEQLTDAQRETLKREGESDGREAEMERMIEALHAQVERALEQLRSIDESRLAEPREVGRARLPSTMLGLLFHAAEHTQRHVGQLLVTVRVQQPHG